MEFGPVCLTQLLPIDDLKDACRCPIEENSVSKNTNKVYGILKLRFRFGRSLKKAKGEKK